MFSLIITIISIALVSALALATIFYGGSAFKQGSTQAAAAQFINEAQQINGAAELYQVNTGNAPVSTADLVTANYLSKVPSAGWTVIDGAVIREMANADICLAANKVLGISVIPVCGDPAYTGKEYCCTQPE